MTESQNVTSNHWPSSQMNEKHENKKDQILY